MPCSYTLKGIARDCEVNAGGIRRVLIAPYDDVASYAVDALTGMISTITMETAKTFLEYYQKKGVANYTGTPSFNEDGDYVGEDGTLALVFSKMGTAKRTEVEALSRQDLVVIFQDANGKWFYLGADNPVTRSGGDTATGTAQTDRNGYAVELHSSDNGSPLEVDPTIISGLLPA